MNGVLMEMEMTNADEITRYMITTQKTTIRQ